jgi:predicted MFS family arabinose efflux permease
MAHRAEGNHDQETLERAGAARLHYAWIVAGVTFLVLLTTAGVRATPGVLMVPLEAEFGWSRATISLAVAVNIALFGLIGPFAATLMERYGLVRVVLWAVALLSCGVALTSVMSQSWQLILLWGFVVGSGTGVTSSLLAAIIANRWFDERRGLVLGALSAANATGQLVFLPSLARLVEHHGWRSASLTVSGVAAVVFLLVLLFLRDRPEKIGLLPYGRPLDSPPRVTEPPRSSLAALAWAARKPEFWALAGTFFVCGASTNGLIGTHLISACHDYGIPEVRAASLLAAMGVFDIVGTTASGWLTDRYSPRFLLFGYYGLRGVALLFLPHTLAQGGGSLGWFALIYGLDWVATVPPTVRLTSDAFGRENTGVVYGWIVAAHQMGASMAAFGAGAVHTLTGDYQLAFWASGALCIVASTTFLLLGNRAFGSAAEQLEVSEV